MHTMARSNKNVHAVSCIKRRLMKLLLIKQSSARRSDEREGTIARADRSAGSVIDYVERTHKNMRLLTRVDERKPSSLYYTMCVHANNIC